MEESGGDERDPGNEITLLAEELVQLSIKRSMVKPADKPTLICSVWTKKQFSFDSFQAQMRKDDLEQILEGRHWLFRKYLILFDRLACPIERDLIRLTSSPYWIKIGPCLPDFDKKDLMHAIGSTFGGVIRFEILDDFCRLKVVLDVQNPLRRGIFASSGNNDCELISLEEKNIIKEDPPFSVALKAESKAVGRESMKFAAFSKSKGFQSSYTGGLQEGTVDCVRRAEPMADFESLINGRKLSRWEDGLNHNEDVTELIDRGMIKKLMESDVEQKKKC
ncbi:Zinc finger, CCHC-type-like protein [Gossypium australe]|uniref:Zinc finger, CCHC-type-like protein n=1 Tax=Gossypium australe TaxID=47621 RepID=A0A5B6WH38_9ROSI|nr:Zinc finger, CCHC-type-like protein [Gossypium australe]